MLIGRLVDFAHVQPIGSIRTDLLVVRHYSKESRKKMTNESSSSTIHRIVLGTYCGTRRNNTPDIEKRY